MSTSVNEIKQNRAALEVQHGISLEELEAFLAASIDAAIELGGGIMSALPHVPSRNREWIVIEFPEIGDLTIKTGKELHNFYVKQGVNITIGFYPTWLYANHVPNKPSFSQFAYALNFVGNVDGLTPEFITSFYNDQSAHFAHKETSTNG